MTTEIPAEVLAPLARTCRERLVRERVLSRVLARDTTLWAPPYRDEAVRRLGWLDLPDASRHELAAWRALGEAARSEGVEAVLLLGMGGSSRGAAVLSRPLPAASRSPSTTVCDSTHPDHVRAIVERLPPRHTWLIVATKSGTTAETRALATVFRRWIRDAGADPDRQSLALTDAGSALTDVAASWRAVVTPPSDVGGRFSALSAYGLLLPTLAGVDVAPVVEGASRCLAALLRGETGVVEPLLAVAASVAAAAREGWPLRIETHAEELGAWPGWLEQLLAESLGKLGVGLIPVAAGSGHVHGRRFLGAEFVLAENGRRLDEQAQAERLLRAVPTPEAMGAEMLTWELVTSLVASCLGVFPFDQPDVERAKQAARRALAGETEAIAPPLPVPSGENAHRKHGWIERDLRVWLDAARGCAYATVQLFGPPEHPLGVTVDGFCGALAEALGRTVTWGYGPRYLHSTGQLQKGGPPVAVMQLLVPPRGGDIEVPGETFGLWDLLRAQAAGDAAALAALSRSVLRVELDGAPEEAVRVLQGALHAL
ncbi:MAG: hypothetical protein ACRD2Z_07620 [Thermoanaerobaculia bacterium]